MSEANAEAIEAWNTVLFDKFVRFRHVVADGLGAHGDAVIERHPPRAGFRVLDVGCGFGDTSRQLATIVGARGEVVGVDGAERFIETARREAAEAGLNNVRFLTADVQSDDLEGPYDQVFSRFGTMFFASPVAALRNMRRALKADGLLSIACWRKREDNEFMHAAELEVRAIVPEPEHSDEPTCGPGPFSMAGADMVSDQLRAAGFGRPTFERFDTEIRIGNDLADAIEFAMALGPAGEVLRLAGEEAERLEPKVIGALRQALAPFVRDNGVFAHSSSWIITARPA